MTDYYASEEWKSRNPGHPGGEKSTRFLLAESGLAPGDKILDLCCGTGISARLLTELGYGVTGTDRHSPQENKEIPTTGMLDTRQTGTASQGMTENEPHGQRDGGAPWVFCPMGEACTLPFGDASFDGVLCECSFSLFEEQMIQMAGEVRRVLRPGGVFMLSDMYERARDVCGDEEHQPLPAEEMGHPQDVPADGKLKNRNQWASFLSEAGFVQVRAEDISRELQHFAAQYLWETGSIFPACAQAAGRHASIKELGYFHGVWRKSL